MRASRLSRYFVVAAVAMIAVQAPAATLDISAGALSYAAANGVVNRLSITKSNTNYAFTDTGEAITLSANANAAGWSGSGTNSVTGPIASAPNGFAVDLRDQADTLVAGSVTVTGAMSLSSGGSIAMADASSLLTASTLTLTATAGVGSKAQPINTAVAKCEARTATGGIYITNSGPLDIGGVTASLSGIQVTTAGDVQITTSGTLNVIVDGDTVASPGAILLRSSGDLNTGGQSAGAAVRGLAAAYVALVAGNDLNLGNAAGIGSVTAATGEIDLFASRNLNINANAVVTSGGTAIMYIAATANVTMAVTPGTIPNAPLISTGGDLILQTTGLFTADSTGPDAVVAAIPGIVADNIDIRKRIVATDRLIVQPSTNDRPIDVGTKSSGALGVIQSEINLLASKYIFIGTPGASPITVSAPITTPANVFQMGTDGPYSGTGAITLTAMPATFAISDDSTTPHVWNITGSSFKEDGGGTIGYSASNFSFSAGFANDTVNVVPSATTGIVVYGNDPRVPSSPGDILNIDVSGTTSPVLNYTPGGWSGSVTFTNRRAVTFSAFESGNVIPSRFLVSAPTTTTAGSPFNLTATATDQLSNPTPLYLRSVQFASSDAQAVLPPGVAVVNGTGAFSATLKTAGTKTITVTDSALPAMTGTASIVVAPAAAARLTANAPVTVPAATPFLMTVSAFDAFDNTATTYTGTVHFTSSDPAAILPANGPLTSGIAAFSSKLMTGGAQTVTATDAANPALTAVVPVNVTLSDARIAMSVSAPLRFGNQNITYTIVATNDGPDSTPAVVVTNTLPSGSRLVSATPAGVCSGTGTLNCSMGALASGASTMLTIVVQAPPEAGTLTNRATIAAAGDLNSSNDAASASVALLAAQDIPFASPIVLLLLAVTLAFIAVARR